MYSGISIIALKILLLYLYKYSKSILIQKKLDYLAPDMSSLGALSRKLDIMGILYLL